MTTAAAFRAAIEAAGMVPPHELEPGRLVRFPGIDKRKGDAGWAVLFPDGKGGSFGCWATGLKSSWFPARSTPMTITEKAEHRRHVEAAQAAARAQRAAGHTLAAARARRLWKAAGPAPDDHPYLIAKCIRPYGARIHLGALVLPVQTFAGRLSSLQFIGADGRKILLRGGAKRGRFIRVSGGLKDPALVLVAEGFASGATLAEDDASATVLASIDCGNLTRIAIAARRRWPDAEIIVCGDDDRLTDGNPGRTAAIAAARAARARVAFPQWPDGCPDGLSDFNDLARWLHTRRVAA